MVPDGEREGEPLLEVPDQLHGERDLGDENDRLPVGREVLNGAQVELGLPAPRDAVDEKGGEISP